MCSVQGEGYTSAWNKAVRLNYRQSPLRAVAVATGKVIFWHWLQPLLYFAVLYCVRDDIDGLQLTLGVAVGAREALYLISSIACLYVHPSFLLVDVGATVRSKTKESISGWLFLSLYVLAPEIFVVLALCMKGGLDNRRWLNAGVVLMLVLDLAGVAALIVGICFTGFMPVSLAIGYGATAIGGVYFILDRLFGA